jgi:hypothetical protein
MPQTNKPAPRTWLQVRPRAPRLQAQRVEFRFFPKYILSFWSPPSNDRPRLAVRGSSVFSNSEMLLLDDVILLPNDSMFIRAWLVPGRMPEHYHMRVEMFAPPTVKRNVRVKLYWDTHEYHAVVRAGHYFFEDITPPDYSRRYNNLPTRRLRLAFEFENRGANGANGNHKTNGSTRKH